MVVFPFGAPFEHSADEGSLQNDGNVDVYKVPNDSSQPSRCGQGENIIQWIAFLLVDMLPQHTAESHKSTSGHVRTGITSVSSLCCSPLPCLSCKMSV